MSNVVSLKVHRSEVARSKAAGAARDTAALVSDLVEIVAGLKSVSGRAASLTLQVRAGELEQTIQLLLDAMASVERAADTLTDSGDFPSSW
jgi:hypothetical protein